MRHNWRTGKTIRRIANLDFEKGAIYGFLDEEMPIAYVSKHPQCMPKVFPACEVVHMLIRLLRADRFLYTAETYNNPQKVWTFVLVSLSI
jgi:hypothetical protein